MPTENELVLNTLKEFKDDIRDIKKSIGELTTEVKTNNERTDAVHKVLFGNGRPGMKEEFDNIKGGMGVFKWIAGSGLMLALIDVIYTFLTK